MNTNKTHNSIEIIITPELAGERIDKIVATLPEVSSRSRALQLIDQGHVTLQSKIVKASLKAREGCVFQIVIPNEKKDVGLTKYDHPLDILYEDDDVIVLNKPAGLVVHPSVGHSENTLVNALLNHTENLSMGFNETRPGIVHRLDKDTSGLLVVCKNNRAHENIALQFKNRSTHRLYWALVFGRPSFQTRRVETLLGRHPNNRKKFANVKVGGKKAITNITTLKTNNGLSHLQLKLDTGRTHQIRVHVSELGYPIIGDHLYSGGKKTGTVSKELRSEIESLNRIGLHAKELGFNHPTTKKDLFFSTEWPSDLQKIVSLCEF